MIVRDKGASQTSMPSLSGISRLQYSLSDCRLQRGCLCEARDLYTKLTKENSIGIFADLARSG